MKIGRNGKAGKDYLKILKRLKNRTMINLSDSMMDQLGST